MDMTNSVDMARLRSEADKIIEKILAYGAGRAVFWVDGELRSYPAHGKLASKFVDEMPKRFVGVYDCEATSDLVISDALALSATPWPDRRAS